MLDGLGMAETTPGPLIMVRAVRRLPGRLPQPRRASTPLVAGVARRGCSTTWVTFVPCFLWIFLGAPYIEALRGNRALDARAVGDHRRGGRRDPQPRASGSRCTWSSREVEARQLGPLRLLVPDLASLSLPSLVIAGAAVYAMLRAHVGMLPTLAASAAAGAAWRLAAG